MTESGYTEELNGFFYRARPHEYFHYRLFNLILTLTKDKEIAEVAREGLKYGFVTVELGEKESDEQHLSPQWAYATCESQVLVHHIAEVLLRMFFAHRGLPRCPVLQLSSLRVPNDFKKALRSFLKEPETSRRNDLLNVFWGQTSFARLEQEHPGVDWPSGAAAIERLLIHAAQRLLNEAPLYNAAKHGLAVTTGRSALSVDFDGIDLGMSTAGLNIEYLEYLGREQASEQWRHTTRWIDEKTDIAICYQWTHLIKSLWSIAMNRYLGVDGYSIYCVADEGIERLLEEREQPLSAVGRRFSVSPDGKGSDN